MFSHKEKIEFAKWLIKERNRGLFDGYMKKIITLCELFKIWEKERQNA